MRILIKTKFNDYLFNLLLFLLIIKILMTLKKHLLLIKKKFHEFKKNFLYKIKINLKFLSVKDK